MGSTFERFTILSALRHANFRIYWLGLVISVLGFQMMMVVQVYLVYELTNSPLYIGLVGLCQAVPTIVLSLLGGAIADRIDRRKLIVLTQSASMILLFILATLTVTGLVSVWHILLIALAMGAVTAFDQPTRQALLPHLIAREDMANAVALQSMVWQGTRVVGPAIGGFLYKPFGPGFCFYVTAASFLIMVLAMLLIRVSSKPSPSELSIASQIGEGLVFIGRSSVFSTLIGMTFFNSIFGMSFRFLMPIYVAHVLGMGPEAVGILLGAAGLGAFLGTIIAASLGNEENRGRTLMTGAVIFGLCLIGFSVSTWYAISIALMIVGNGFNSVYMINVQTLLQTQVPDQLRGRVMGIYNLAYSLIPLSGTQGGLVANVMGTPFAIGFGGFAVAAFTGIMWASSSKVRNLGRSEMLAHT